MITNTNPTDKLLTGHIAEAIGREIKREAERVYEEYKLKMIEELDRTKAQTIAGIVIQISRMVDIKEYNDRLVISIDNKQAKV